MPATVINCLSFAEWLWDFGLRAERTERCPGRPPFAGQRGPRLPGVLRNATRERLVGLEDQPAAERRQRVGQVVVHVELERNRQIVSGINRAAVRAVLQARDVGQTRAAVNAPQQQVLPVRGDRGEYESGAADAERRDRRPDDERGRSGGRIGRVIPLDPTVEVGGRNIDHCASRAQAAKTRVAGRARVRVVARRAVGLVVGDARAVQATVGVVAIRVGRVSAGEAVGRRGIVNASRCRVARVYRAGV